ncbi:hypothetical protein FNF29_01637 [Cafeteria roenbergensis]|uniref:J domain-containing protein n=2 Tax=Cafeteria roenbergensis TaxID=33653 RepID=A0A5A8CRI9_CAFRO|nr:hypothetical protein FNF29_01637 [Cafeteria roenbergensis]|eukprot:KAA0155722.1 hypothetical protein FNF29_01637 [Cafeteria roenbergensis]
MAGQLDYDGSAFRYFAACMLMLYLIPGGWFAWAAHSAFKKSTGPEAVKGRSKPEAQMLKTRIGRIKLFTPCFMLNLAMLVTAVLCLCYLVPSILTEAAIKQYDPFAILGIEDTATDREIKKAYRKLSLKYHPDKRQGNEDMFVHITKAYQALTDEVAKENFRLYGNPDGKQAIGFGIGLPAFLTDEANRPFVLAGYIVALVVGVPFVFYLLYLSCRGVEAPRLKMRIETANYTLAHIKEQNEPFQSRKFRVSEVVAGLPDLQDLAQKAVKGGKIDIDPEALEDLVEVIEERLDSAGGAGALVPSADASSIVVASPGQPTSLWPAETGEPVTLLPRVKLWNPLVEAEYKAGPPRGDRVQVVHRIRYDGLPPSEQRRGIAPSMFINPLVFDRNHALLWAHMLRISPDTPALQAILSTGAGAETLQQMLMLAEQGLVASAQTAARGAWINPATFVGANPPSREDADAIIKAMGKRPAAAAKASAKSKVKKRKTAAERTLAKKIRQAKEAGDEEELAKLEAKGAAKAESRASSIETGYAADDLEGDDKLDWAEAVKDFHRGVEKLSFNVVSQQRPADCVRTLLMAQRIAQALPPTASPLAQIPALASNAALIDMVGTEALKRAVARRRAAADGEDVDEDSAAGTTAAAAATAGKPRRSKARKAAAKSATVPHRRTKLDDPDDALPGEDDDVPEDEAEFRQAWPQWFRLARRGWFADRGELAALAELPAEERATLLAGQAVDPQAAQEVEDLVRSLPRVSLEASATIKRFDFSAAGAGGAPRLKEEFDAFETEDEDGEPHTVQENEIIKVDVILRHENFGCTAPEGGPAPPAKRASTDGDEEDDEDAKLPGSGEPDDGDDGDDIIEEDDGITVRKSRRPVASVAPLADEPNAQVPVPEPHTPFLDRPLPKTERWALFVCTDRGWILNAETLWSPARGIVHAIHTADAKTARVDVSIPERFLPGPGEHRLFVVAMCLDYAGLDVVQELGTIRLDVNRMLPRSEERMKTLRLRAQQAEKDKAMHRAHALNKKEAEGGAGSEDSESDGEGAEDAAGEEEEEEQGGDIFEELHTIVRPANQLDDEDEDAIE